MADFVYWSRPTERSWQSFVEQIRRHIDAKEIRRERLSVQEAKMEQFDGKPRGALIIAEEGGIEYHFKISPGERLSFDSSDDPFYWRRLPVSGVEQPTDAVDVPG